MSEQDSFGTGRWLMREFLSAGGELIIHGALYLKNSPSSEIFRLYDSRLICEKKAVQRKSRKDAASVLDHIITRQDTTLIIIGKRK